MKKITVFSLFVAAFLTLLGCKSKMQHYQPEYTNTHKGEKVLLFGVPSQSYYELSDSMVKYLNEHLHGVRVQTVATSSFAKYNDQLANGYYDFTIANGLTALKSISKGYLIVGKVVEATHNSGSIVVNKDSSINSIIDLRGKTVATPGPPALPGHMLQMVYLARHGVNPNMDIKFKYFESFESVFLNVYLGRCSAGFCTTTSWNNFVKRRPEIVSRVVHKWQTPGITGNAVLVRANLDSRNVKELRELFLTMNISPQGRNALTKLGYLRFDTADSSSYEPVKEFMKEYDSKITATKQ